MTKKIKLAKPIFFQGSVHGIIGATALISLKMEGQLNKNALSRLSSYSALTALNAADPHYGIDPENWVSSFVQRAPKKPEFAHIIAALTVAFQRWARDPVSKAVVISGTEEKVQMAVPWHRPQICKSSLILALEYVRIASAGSPSLAEKNEFVQQFGKFLQQAHKNHLAPNTMRFALAAIDRGIPVYPLNDRSVQIGWGAGQIRLLSSFTHQTSNIAARLARNKFLTNQRLAQNKLPVPRAALAATFQDAGKIAETLGWPVVVKPATLDQGAGVTAGVKDTATLRAAFDAAHKLTPESVMVEKHIAGDDHRLLVVKGRLLMATRRVAGGVTGDGVSTIEQLIEQTNKDPLRGKGKRSLLIRLELDDVAQSCLVEAGFAATDVPPRGQFVALRKTANISTGGTATDVSDRVHPDNEAAAIRAARVLGLDIAGVDFLCPDISKSYRKTGTAICEVNAQPGFRPHWLSDPTRDINGEIVDILTAGNSPRIPTAAITGTNGKSTTAKMLHHIWQASGKTAGVCTTAGTWVGEDMIDDTNLSGHPGALMLFRDSMVESAIIELPRKGLILYGQPCDAYDVAALLNVSEDHIGVDGINSIEEMARLKAGVIARATGAVVINADDELCMEMRKFITAPRTILMAQSKSNSVFSEHLKNGGEGVFIKVVAGQDCLVFAEGGTEASVISVADIPATQGGLIHHNILNSMSAVALAWAQGLPLETIRQALGTFTNTIECNPGRYNYVEGFPFQLMLDYAHNPVGASTVVDYVEHLPVAGRRILFCQKIGNRRRADMTEMAPHFKRVFDEIVLSTDPDRVARNPEYAGDNPEEIMLSFARGELQDAGCPAEKITTEADLGTAIKIALSKAKPGDFVLMLTDTKKTYPFLEELRDER